MPKIDTRYALGTVASVEPMQRPSCMGDDATATKRSVLAIEAATQIAALMKAAVVVGMAVVGLHRVRNGCHSCAAIPPGSACIAATAWVPSTARKNDRASRTREIPH